MLTPGDLARVRSLSPQQEANASGGAVVANGACAQVEGAIAQLQVIGAGRLRFSGRGELIVDQNAWSRLPGEHRDLLLRTLAIQNRCKTGVAKGAASVRGVDGGRIIGSYREP